MGKVGSLGFGLSLVIVFATGVAVSHAQFYVGHRERGGEGDSTQGVDCGIGSHILLNLSFGGVCFGADEESGWDNGNEGLTDILGNPAGSSCARHLGCSSGNSATLDITDSSGFDMPATYCQVIHPPEVGSTKFCGGNGTGAAETGAEDANGDLPQCNVPHREGSTGCLYRSVPYVDFCDSITIRGGFTDPLAPGSRRIGGVDGDLAGSGTWADPLVLNWNVDHNALVFVSAPANGNTVTGSVCGTNAWSIQGFVSHT